MCIHKSKKALSIVLALLMFVTSFSVLQLIDDTQAFAATLAKPSVTLTNVSPTSIKVSWKAVSGASKYTVYRSTNKSSGFKSVKTTTSTSFTNSSLTCGKTYYYKVKAIKGTNSATSSVVSKKAVPAKASAKISATCSSIKISWSKLSGVSGYQIYYSTSKSGTYKKLASTTAVSYTNKSLKLGTTRYYKVRAYKKVGKSYVYGAFSTVVSKKTAHTASTAWTITKKATCAQTGTKTNVCKYCKKKYSATIAKDTTNHQYVKTEKPATKTYEAYSEYKCSRCGDSYTSKKKEHKYKATVTEPTCTQRGYTTYECANGDYSYVGDYTEIIPHSYEIKSVSPNCVQQGYDINVCTVCGYEDADSKTNIKEPLGTAHSYETKTIEATCNTEGYTAAICTDCGYVDEASKTDVIAALGHDYPVEYYSDENGYRYYTCARCDKIKQDTTCYIDLAQRTISVPAVAVFGKSATNNTDKLDLNPDGVSSYEITGSAENITIDVNASVDTDVKLAGVTIINENMDCIDIKDKSEDESLNSTADVIVEDIIPEVSVSAKDGTENVLTVTGSGNAIECSCELSLKGHGKITAKTVSTAISCEGKLNIKNLVLDITSNNRGIDTKRENKNAAGLIINTEYYNIKVQDNAIVTINSDDDCIRCKNMEFDVLTEGNADTVMILNSSMGDGIQLEGKKGLTMHSGNVTITAGKNPLNNKSGIAPIIDGTAQLNV